MFDALANIICNLGYFFNSWRGWFGLSVENLKRRRITWPRKNSCYGDRYSKACQKFHKRAGFWIVTDCQKPENKGSKTFLILVCPQKEFVFLINQSKTKTSFEEDWRWQVSRISCFSDANWYILQTPSSIFSKDVAHLENKKSSLFALLHSAEFEKGQKTALTQKCIDFKSIINVIRDIQSYLLK